MASKSDDHHLNPPSRSGKLTTLPSRPHITYQLHNVGDRRVHTGFLRCPKHEFFFAFSYCLSFLFNQERRAARGRLVGMRYRGTFPVRLRRTRTPRCKKEKTGHCLRWKCLFGSWHLCYVLRTFALADTIAIYYPCRKWLPSNILFSAIYGVTLLPTWYLRLLFSLCTCLSADRSIRSIFTLACGE